MGICDGPHNLRNDIIKQIKHRLIGEGTIIRFGDIFCRRFAQAWMAVDSVIAHCTTHSRSWLRRMLS